MRITGSRYKRQQWKQRQKTKNDESNQSTTGMGRNSCFKCGRRGHWARNCTNTGGYKNLGKFDGQSVSHTDDDTGVFEEGVDLQQLLHDERVGPTSCVFPTIDEAHQLLKNTITSTDANDVSMETSPSLSDQSSYQCVEPFLELENGEVMKSNYALYMYMYCLLFMYMYVRVQMYQKRW